MIDKEVGGREEGKRRERERRLIRNRGTGVFLEGRLGYVVDEMYKEWVCI